MSMMFSLGLGPSGRFGRERVEIAVDSGQLRFHDFLLFEGLLKVLVQDVYSVLEMLGILCDGILLRGQRLLDADVIQGVTADGVDFGGGKRIAHLSEYCTRGYR